jgi:hypothetical protein
MPVHSPSACSAFTISIIAALWPLTAQGFLNAIVAVLMQVASNISVEPQLIDLWYRLWTLATH